MITNRAIAIVLVGCCMQACASPGCSLSSRRTTKSMPTFKTSFDQFMHALATKDRLTFNTFLDAKAFSLAILPPSRTFDSLRAYEASQDSWFKGTSGSFEYTVERAEEEAQLALGVVRAKYSNIDAQGKPFAMDLWISFVFKNIDNHWKLLFVQNTRVE